MIGELPGSRTKMHVLKVRGGEQMTVVGLAKEPLGFHTHWLGTRSFMCPGVDCVACLNCVGSRWVGWLPVRWLEKDAEIYHVSILELALGTYDRLNETLRSFSLSSVVGVPCRASRTRNRASLRLDPLISHSSELVEVDEFAEWLLLDVLSTLYGLPSCPEGLGKSSWEAVAIPRAATMVRIAMKRAGLL